jgi:hypothetical protein
MKGQALFHPSGQIFKDDMNGFFSISVICFMYVYCTYWILNKMKTKICIRTCWRLRIPELSVGLSPHPHSSTTTIGKIHANK